MKDNPYASLIRQKQIFVTMNIWLFCSSLRWQHSKLQVGWSIPLSIRENDPNLSYFSLQDKLSVVCPFFKRNLPPANEIKKLRKPFKMTPWGLICPPSLSIKMGSILIAIFPSLKLGLLLGERRNGNYMKNARKNLESEAFKYFP